MATDLALRDPLYQDPLFKQYYDLGANILDLYSPEQEAQRKTRALGGLKQTLGERYARAGLTGSSPELDALQNAASNFELDWAAREPAQKAAALTAANLPISNLEQMISREASYGGTYAGQPSQQAKEFDVRLQESREARDWLRNQQDLQLLGGTLGALGIPQWLARELFGVTGQPGAGTGGLVGQAGQGLVTSLLTSLFGGGASAPTEAQQSETAALARQNALDELATMGGGGAVNTGLTAASGLGTANTVSGLAGGPTIQGVLSGGGTLAAPTAAQQAAAAGLTQQQALAELASLVGPTAAPAASLLAPGGVGAAAPSIEAGLVELLGPELAAQLGYAPAAAAPAVAASATGLAGTVGPTMAQIAAEFAPAGVYGGLGAEIGAAGAAAPAAAWALPVAAVGIPWALGGMASAANNAQENAERQAAQQGVNWLSANPQYVDTIRQNLLSQINFLRASQQASGSTPSLMDIPGQGNPFFGTPIEQLNLGAQGQHFFSSFPELSRLYQQWADLTQAWGARQPTGTWTDQPRLPWEFPIGSPEWNAWQAMQSGGS